MSSSTSRNSSTPDLASITAILLPMDPHPMTATLRAERIGMMRIEPLRWRRRQDHAGLPDLVSILDEKVAAHLRAVQQEHESSSRKDKAALGERARNTAQVLQAAAAQVSPATARSPRFARAVLCGRTSGQIRLLPDLTARQSDRTNDVDERLFVVSCQQPCASQTTASWRPFAISTAFRRDRRIGCTCFARFCPRVVL